MEVKNSFSGIYKNKTVLVTGNNGFKGSWLCLWLKELGANVIGFAPENSNKESLCNRLNLNLTQITGDIRNKEMVIEAVSTYKPEIVFHLAAQPIVTRSYKDPSGTFETNVLGTVNILEAVRLSPSVTACVNITTDKVYKNKELSQNGYKETDELGGHDPYSASKACSELVTESYRKSFFSSNDTALIASARAGNVIGGGDWAEDRLIPDIFRALYKNEKIKLRNPDSIRPWQHVLEPLSGYLLLGAKLLSKEKEFASAWNFGPDEGSTVRVEDIILAIQKHWKELAYYVESSAKIVHETNMLSLDCTKAKKQLQWMPVWDIHKTIEKTTKWYMDFFKTKYNSVDLQKRCMDDLTAYVNDFKSMNALWA